MTVRFALALIGALLVVPAGARAAVTFGADPSLMPDGAMPPACCDAFLTTVTAPADGVLVHWTLRRTGAAVPVTPAVQSGSGPKVTLDPGGQTTATDLAVRVPIRGGDELGLRAPMGGTMPQAFNGSTLLVAGVIEPDADHDGYGDETQDACPAEAALHVAPCTADVAVTMSGPAFGVVDRDTPYVVTIANQSRPPAPTRRRATTAPR